MRIGIVLLAAGESRRFGGNKLAAEVDGRPMYKIAIEKAGSLEVEYKAIVTGQPQILEEGRKAGFHRIENHRPELGIGYSIQLAAAAAEGRNLDGVMFMVCDQPWLRTSTLRRMLSDYDGGILALRYGSQTGNPVIFSAEYLEELKILKGDRGGRQVMDSHRDQLRFLEAEFLEELKDVDRREDMEKDTR